MAPLGIGPAKEYGQPGDGTAKTFCHGVWVELQPQLDLAMVTSFNEVKRQDLAVRITEGREGGPQKVFILGPHRPATGTGTRGRQVVDQPLPGIVGRSR